MKMNLKKIKVKSIASDYFELPAIPSAQPRVIKVIREPKTTAARSASIDSFDEKGGMNSSATFTSLSRERSAFQNPIKIQAANTFTEKFKVKKKPSVEMEVVEKKKENTDTNKGPEFRIRPQTPKVNLLELRQRIKKKEQTEDFPINENAVNQDIILETFEEKFMRMLEDGEYNDNLELNEKFLSDYLGIEDAGQLSQLKKIEFMLDASEHNLQTIGEVLTSLIEIKLNGSIVKSIRDLGTSFQGVKVLWMSRCNIVDLSGISAFAALEEFYASFNLIDDVYDLGYLENLVIIDLEGNNVTSYETIENLSNCEKLHSLALHGNPIEKDPVYRKKIPSMIPKLKYLDEISVDNECPGSPKRNTKLNDIAKQSLSELKNTLRDSQVLDKFKNIGLFTDKDIDNHLEDALKSLNEQPNEDEVLLKALRDSDNKEYSKHFTTENTNTSTVESNYSTRPRTAGESLFNSSSGFSTMDESSNAPKRKSSRLIDESGYSDLVSNTDQIFVGNPIKVLKQKIKSVNLKWSVNPNSVESTAPHSAKNFFPRAKTGPIKARRFTEAETDE